VEERKRFLGEVGERSYVLPETIVQLQPARRWQQRWRADRAGRIFQRMREAADAMAGGGRDGVTVPGPGTVSTARLLPEDLAPRDEIDTRTTGEPEMIKYVIRYVGLWCQDETNGPGSDEIFIVTQAAHTNQEQTVAWDAGLQPINWPGNYYGNVDRGDEFEGPMTVVWWGNPDRVDVTVTVYEHDYGDPDKYRDEIDYLVKAAIAIAAKYYPPALVLEEVSGTITDAINWVLDTDDDLLTTEQVHFSREELEELTMVHGPSYYMGTKQASYLSPPQPYTTRLFKHFVTKHREDGAEYVVCFDVQRYPAPPSRPTG
jgi:hypothetical protein